MFVIAAYSTPLAIIEEYITFREDIIPFSGYLSLFLFLYGLVLSVIAVKAVYQFSWFKSLIANFFLPVMLIGSVVLIFVISSPQSALNIADNFMTALKNRDFSQFSLNEGGNEEFPVMQEWPSTIDKDLPIIKVDELISLIKEIDDSIEFEELKSIRWVQTGDKVKEVTSISHSYGKDFGNVKLYISFSNNPDESQLESGLIEISYPEGEFKLHEDKIASLSEKYISSLVTKLVKEHERAEEILSKKYINQDPFASMENARNPNYASFFGNYAYNIYQEKDPTSYEDSNKERIVLMIRIVGNE